MKILICPDSFKGSASASASADAIGRGCLKTFPNAQLELIPLADGGEGTAEILGKSKNWQSVELSVQNLSGKPVKAAYYFNQETRQAVFDAASIVGHSMLNPPELTCKNSHTKGIGEMLISIQEKGLTKLTIGLGGTGTCDGGMGMAASLGFVFRNEKGDGLTPCGENLIDIRSIEKPETNPLDGLQITALCDVTAPLHGPTGSAIKYAAQKGASDDEAELLDEGLKNYANVLKKEFGVNVQSVAGTGAAGGLAAGLMIFGKAKLTSGIETVANEVDLEERLKTTDVVITGEGKVDRQTLQGKAVSRVATLANKHEIPVFAICGSCADPNLAKDLGLDGLIEITGPDVDAQDGMERVLFHLEDCAFTLTDYIQKNG